MAGWDDPQGHRRGSDTGYRIGTAIGVAMMVVPPLLPLLVAWITGE